MLWFHTTPAYQRASCNMDKANTCFPLGCSYYRCCIAGGFFPSFQLDAWRLSAVCSCVISQRVDSLWDTSRTTHWSLVNCSCVHNHILISVGRDIRKSRTADVFYSSSSLITERAPESVRVPQLHFICADCSHTLCACLFLIYDDIICTCKMFPGQ